MKGDCTRVGLLCPADGSSLGYPPSLIASCIFAATFGLSLVCHFALGFKHKTWVFMGVYCTGSLLEVLGYVGRILMRNNPYDLNTLVLPTSLCKQILILNQISPADYLPYDGASFLFGRIISMPFKNVCALSSTMVNANVNSVIAYGEGISRIKPITYTRFFIGCDIISLSLQGAGGGVAASSNSNSSLSLGNNLMLAGLIFQVVTLAIFGILCLDFAIRVNRNPSGKNPAYNTLRSSMRFQGFLFAVLVTFLTILTRSVYRIVELGGGWNNKLQREEIPFIILESV